LLIETTHLQLSLKLQTEAAVVSGMNGAEVASALSALGMSGKIDGQAGEVFRSDVMVRFSPSSSLSSFLRRLNLLCHAGLATILTTLPVPRSAFVGEAGRRR
jgi:hypothetical protein